MGCGASRLDGNGMVLPPKLRPVFLYRLEEIKMRRHARPLKNFDSTPSKKELLLHDDHDKDHEDEKSVSSDKNVLNKIMPLSPKEKIENGKSDSKDKRIEDVKAKAETGVEEDTDPEMDSRDHKDDEDDDERMIGHDDDDGAFPGSPSFRVYFKDDGEDKHNDIIGHENDAFKNTISSDESSKESCENKKVMKSGRKKKSFRKVLPKGGQAAVKNLLNYKSCYNTTPSSGHDQTHLLTGKTSA